MPSQRKAASPDQDNPVARFEHALQELESVVEQLESGEPSLEKTLQLYERGMALSRICRQALDLAELKVRELSEAAEAGSTPDESAGPDDAAGEGRGDENPFDDDTPF